MNALFAKRSTIAKTLNVSGGLLNNIENCKYRPSSAIEFFLKEIKNH
jgi:DNA-binding XRE family transcriptional regulator